MSYSNNNMSYSNDYHQKLNSIPSISSGKISSKLSGLRETELIDIEFKTSFVCTLLQKKRSLTHSFALSLNKNGGVFFEKSRESIRELDSIEHTSANLNNTRTIKFIKRKNGLTQKELNLLEIWNIEEDAGELLKIIDLTELHGRIYPEGSFGGVSWSQKGDKFAYIAERVKEPIKENKSNSKLKFNKDLLEDDYKFKQTWGETYGELCEPAIILVDLNKLEEEEEEGIKVIDIIDEFLAPGQLAYSKDDEVLYFTGYSIFPRKHGIVYCPNRPSDIYKLNTQNGSYAKFTDSKLAYRSPRIIGNYLYYMGMSIGGAHNQCSSIFKSPLNEFNPEEIVPIVNEAQQNEFPGVYTLEFGHFPLINLKNKIFLLFNSQWRCYRNILALEINSNEICSISPIPTKPVSFEESNNYSDTGSWTLLDVNNNYLLAKFSSPSKPGELVLGVPELINNKLTINWSVLKSSVYNKEFNELIPDTKWSTLNFEERDPNLELIIIKNSKISKNRLIANIHGGPHSSNFVEFNITNLLLLKLGFTILHINYSGSLGYGQAYNNKLIGKVGDLDVKDCYHSIQKVLESEGIKEAPFVIGGSHGGFLAAHLIGQYPDTFKAAILHNPVINIGANIFLTDITDWNFSECGIYYNFFEPMEPTAEVYSKLYSHSPHQYFDSIKTPSLVILGDKDLRVPPAQSIQWWFHIRKRHPSLFKIISVPNTGHSIDSAEGTIIRLQSINKFLEKYI
jgi:acylaminoacyl-peptidase